MSNELVYFHKGLSEDSDSKLEAPGFLDTAENISFNVEGVQGLRPKFAYLDDEEEFGSAIHGIKIIPATTRAIIAEGVNLWSGDVPEEVPSTLPPEPPENLAADGLAEQVEISWDSVSEADSYDIYYLLVSGVRKTNGIKIAAVTSPYVHTGLVIGQTYYYIVTASNENGESEDPGEVTGTPTLQLPAPENVAAVAADLSVQISWDAVSGATSYNIYWDTSTGVTIETGTKISGATSPYTHTGRTNGQPYYYVVTAENEDGESDESAEVNGTPFEQEYMVSITVPAASVDAVLTSFPVYVDLSDLPADFWTYLEYGDGRDIRVQTSEEAEIPFDLLFCNSDDQTGALFAKVSLSNAGDTTFYVHFGLRTSDYVAVDADNGRNAVWSDYHRVLFFTGQDMYEDHTGAGDAATVVGDKITRCLIPTIQSGETQCHQGIAYDGTYYYVIGTNTLKKYDASWSLVASNTDPCGDVGVGATQCDDAEVLNGVLYVPVKFGSDSVSIAKFSATDLSFISATDISAQGHLGSSICYCERDGLLYLVSFTHTTTLFKYDPADLSYEGTATLSVAYSQMQGITWWNNRFWITQDEGTIFPVEYDGTVGPELSFTTSQPGTWGGITHTDGYLLIMEYEGINLGKIWRLDPDSVEAGTGIEFRGTNTNYLTISATQYTTWTIGASTKIDATGANRAIVSYAILGGGNNANRTTIAYRNVSNQLGLWNSVDGWLYSAVSPAINTLYRFNAVHNGTTYRKLYTNGAVVTDTGCTAYAAAGANGLYIGIEDNDFTEKMDGHIGFVYLRAEILSAEWIAAEVDNLHAPGSFYSVGAVEES